MATATTLAITCVGAAPYRYYYSLQGIVDPLCKSISTFTFKLCSSGTSWYDAAGAGASDTHIAMNLTPRAVGDGSMMLSNMTSAASAEDHYCMDTIMLMRG